MYLAAPLHAIAVHESLNEVLNLHGDYVLDGEESKLHPKCTPHMHDPHAPAPAYKPQFSPLLTFSVQFGMVGNCRILMQTSAMNKTKMIAPSFMVRVGSLPPPYNGDAIVPGTDLAVSSSGSASTVEDAHKDMGSNNHGMEKECHQQQTIKIMTAHGRLDQPHDVKCTPCTLTKVSHSNLQGGSAQNSTRVCSQSHENHPQKTTSTGGILEE
jgi:hypothetical protein